MAEHNDRQVQEMVELSSRELEQVQGGFAYQPAMIFIIPIGDNGSVDAGYDMQKNVKI